MSRKNTLIVLFYSLNFYLCVGQKLDEVGVRLGFYVNAFSIEELSQFSKKSDIEEIALQLNIYHRNCFGENSRLALTYGFGIDREYLSFYPRKKFIDIKLLEHLRADTLAVAEIANWDWHVTIPIDFSYKLFDQIDILPPLIIIPGMRINVGIENKFTFKRITDNIVLSDYNNDLTFGYEYYDKLINKTVSDYYSDSIRKYKILGNIGFEFFYKYSRIGFLGGIRFNRSLLSPLKYRVDYNISMSGYIGAYYKF